MGDGAGAAGYKIVRPNETLEVGNVSIGGGAGSVHAALSDDSDTTYITDQNATYGRYAKVGFSTVTLTANQRVKRVAQAVRRQKMISSSSVYFELRTFLQYGAASGHVYYSYPADTSIGSGFSTPWYAASVGGTEWSSYASSIMGHVGIAGVDGSDLRVHELFLWVDIRDRITLGTPTATDTTTTRPTLAWVGTENVDGDLQKKYDIYVYPASSYNATGFSPGVSPSSGGQPWAWASGQVAAPVETIQVGTDLAFGTTYKAYVRIAQDFNGQDWWTGYQASSAFTIAAAGDSTPAPPAPTVTRTHDDTRARVVLELGETLNMLTANQSSLETNTTGWAAGTATTIARSTSQASHQTASLALTKITGVGTALAITPSGTSGVLVDPSTPYTAVASFRAAATPRTAKVRVLFYDTAGAYLTGSDLTGSGAADTTSGFTQVAVTGSSPATAAYAAIELQVESAAVSEVHYADKVGLFPGAGTTWSLGGYLDDTATSIAVDYQETIGPNFVPVNVGDGGDADASTAGWYKGTAGDLLDLYAGPDTLQGDYAVRWGPSLSGSALYAGMNSASPTYDLAPLVAPGRTMIASAWVRAETGTFQTSLTLGAHNAAGSTGTAAGSPATVGTDWTLITSGVLTPTDGSLYGYLAFANTAGTTSGRLLVDQVQLELGAAVTDWQPGTGDRPDEWTAHRSSPLTGPDLPASQEVTLRDYEGKRGRGIRVYRVRVEVAEDDSSLASASVYVAAHNAVVDLRWWLKDPLAPALNAAFIRVEDNVGESIVEDVEAVHPLGRDLPVSVATWISGGADGNLTIDTIGEQEWALLERLLRRQNALLLQSPGGMNKYVRLLSRSLARSGGRQSLRRSVSLSYQQEAAP